MSKYTLLLLLCFSMHATSQNVDSVQSLDSIAVTDTLKITDSLKIKTVGAAPDSLDIQDSLKRVETTSDTVITIESDNDSLGALDKSQLVEVKKRHSVKDLHFLVGKWKGEGWRLMPGGQKTYIVQTEIVEAKQNGDVLIIEGVGIDRESLRTKPRVVNIAFGIIYFNTDIQKVQIMAFNRGRRIVTEPDILDDRSFQWGFILPEVGLIRYRVELTEYGDWYEIGEFSQDGERWIQNFEMTLTKIE